MGDKQLYKVTFNYKGEVTDMHTHAFSSHQALTNVLRHIADKLGLNNIAPLYNHCIENSNSYEVVAINEEDRG